MKTTAKKTSKVRAQVNHLDNRSYRRHRSNGSAVRSRNGNGKLNGDATQRLQDKLEKRDQEIESLKEDIANVHLMFDALDIPPTERAYERLMGFAENWRRRASSNTHPYLDAQKMMNAIHEKMWFR